MKTFNYRRSLIALAVAACGTTAYAQSPCDAQIRQLEQDVQQSQLAQERQSEVRDLLRAAERRPDDCNVYVTRAQELMQQRTQGGQQSTAQAAQQRAQQPAQQADRTTDIQVDQAPAEVDVQTESPQIVVKQQPAEVTVEQQPPEVEITQSEPQITVEQPEPNVTVDRAQPQVEVTQSEPDVRVQQSEPNVRVVQPEAEAEVQTAQAGQERSQQPADVSLEDVQGKQALSSGGEELGEVDTFVRSRSDGSAHALVSVGGVLGIGARSIAIPLDQVRLDPDGNLQTQLSQEEVEQTPEYDEQQYEQIPESEFAALEAELERQ